ncbi:MAG: acyltransferase, partial [Proteobacteria bacterium]|nr:acyltransferase [Pseudomonadota bacterium]
VTIFFFLSGYLITTLMLAESELTGEIDILKFYARRVFRLMPPLLITLAIAYSLTYFGWLQGGISLYGLAAQVSYFANYYGIFFDPGNTVPDGTGILWSLAVEEHFYMFYPLLMSLLLGSNVRPRTIAALLGLGCLAILAWRIHLIGTPGFNSLRTYYASDTRIDSIIYGCILAIVANPVKAVHRGDAMSPTQWALLATAGAMLLGTLLYRDETFREGIRYSLQGLALMPIFYFAIRFSDCSPFRFLNWPWVKKIGVYSYVIYLSHYVVIRLFAADFPAIAAKPYLMFPIAFLTSIAFAAAVDRFVDPYFRGLRRQFRPGAVSRPAILRVSE